MSLAMVLAFIRRDVRIARTYRAAFVGQIAGTLLFLFTFGLVQGIVEPTFALRYGASYFSYAAVGIAATGALMGALGAFSGSLREAQVDGTLESMLLAPVPQSTVLTLLGVWPLVLGFVGACLTLLAAALGGAGFHVDVASLVLAVVLSSVSFAGLGLLAAAGVLVAKRGNPVAALVGMVGSLTAGAYVPIDTFPGWLQVLAVFNPMTYAVRAWRGALLEATPPWEMAGSLAVLAGVAIVGLPLARTALRRALDLARADGTLATY